MRTIRISDDPGDVSGARLTCKNVDSVLESKMSEYQRRLYDVSKLPAPEKLAAAGSLHETYMKDPTIRDLANYFSGPFFPDIPKLERLVKMESSIYKPLLFESAGLGENDTEFRRVQKILIAANDHLQASWLFRYLSGTLGNEFKRKYGTPTAEDLARRMTI